jgi:hypothetical protein
MDINDITYAINGAVFEVNRVLGSGFLEKVYPVKLLEELLCITHMFYKAKTRENFI